MPPVDKKVSIVLTGSVDNRSMPELVAPLVQQGESPKLVKSTNTRLSKVPGSCARAPKFTRILQFAPGTKRWGIIPSKLARNAIIPGGLALPGHYLAGDGASTLGTGPGTDSNVRQDAYVPSRIVSSGAMDARPVESHIAVGHNATTGVVWRAYPAVTYGGSTNVSHELWVSAWSVSGEELASPLFSGGISTSVIRWVGLTTHGVIGDRVWYADGSGITYRALTLSGRTISFGIPVVVALPGQPMAGVDVVGDGAGFVYLAHSRVGSATDGTLRRVDVSSASSATTTHSVDIAGALAGGGKCAVHFGTLNGAARVAVAFSRATSAKTTTALYGSTLSVVGAPFERDGFGDVALGFYEHAIQSRRDVVCCVSPATGDFAGDSTSYQSGAKFLGTLSYATSVSSWGVSVTERRFPWLVLQAHAVHWVRGADQFPVFFLGRSYGDTNNAPGGGNYVDDPCVEAWLWMTVQPLPMARFGTVRGTLAPAYTAAQACLASRSCFMAGDRFTFVYRKQPRVFTQPFESTGRHVVVDLAESQPRVAHDKDGCALIATPLPAQFDGERFMELGGPLHAPKIAVDSTGAVPSVPNGVYSFAVVYEWTDNAGVVHRSRPSNIVTRTASGTAFAVVLTTIDSLDTSLFGKGTTFALLYVTETNGKDLYLYERKIISIQLSAFAFNVSTAGGNAANPKIFSTGTDGEELLPQPAPPLRDITTIGPRAWGIDAEVPTRVVYSKLRVAGVGYEFVPSLEINLPSAAGEAHAVRDWQGMAVVLCERGVYQVSGDGPSNTLNAGEGTGLTGFSQPIKLSDIVCTNGPSAVAFPGGIIWQSGQRFALLVGGGVDFLPNFNATYDVMHAMLLRRYEEVLFFSSAVTEVRAYNHATQRWTTWDSQVLEGPVTAAALLPYNEDLAFVYSEATGFVYRLDADSVSTCANMTWETDWTLLGGDFQDHVLLRDVIFNGTILGPHSITIEVYCDYETTPSTVRTWTHADQGSGPTLVPGLASIAVGGRYSVRVDPREINARAVKLKVYDAVAAPEVDRRGVQPRSLTIVYAIDGLLYETAFVEGSRK